MRNFKIIVQYEGTRYQGWQRQESTANTIQGKLEALLTKMCEAERKPAAVEVTGSGRTDAGVHSLGQTANFHLDTLKKPNDIMKYMNAYLPEDIAVVQIEEVDGRFHSRLLAREKTYCYRVMNSEVPHIFDRRYVYEYPGKLHVENMRKAAGYLCGTHDFKAFTSAKRGRKSTVRTLKELRIEEIGEEIRFTFTGDGFLYHMVRILAGTLLETGEGLRKPEEIPLLFESGRREDAGRLVPAKGLVLAEVRY